MLPGERKHLSLRKCKAEFLYNNSTFLYNLIFLFKFSCLILFISALEALHISITVVNLFLLVYLWFDESFIQIISTSYFIYSCTWDLTHFNNSYRSLITSLSMVWRKFGKPAAPTFPHFNHRQPRCNRQTTLFCQSKSYTFLTPSAIFDIVHGCRGVTI